MRLSLDVTTPVFRISSEKLSLVDSKPLRVQLTGPNGHFELIPVTMKTTCYETAKSLCGLKPKEPLWEEVEKGM